MARPHARECQAIEKVCDDLVASGELVQSGVDDLVTVLSPRVSWLHDRPMVGTDTLAEAVKTSLAARPHLKPVEINPHEADMNNLTTRGLMQKTMRPDLFQALLEQGGLTGPGDTRKWIMPDDALVKKPSERDNPANPFSRSGWNVTKQAQLVKALGLQKAADIARSAGVTVGATKPAA